LFLLPEQVGESGSRGAVFARAFFIQCSRFSNRINMAGDWIKMRSDLLTHPKVVRMMSALKADKLRVIGGLHAVWCLFDMHSEDGTLDGYSPEILDDHLGWAGFSSAMIGVSWLIDNESNLSVPRFDEHNGQSAKRRAQESERKRDARKTSAHDAEKKRTREEKRREDIKPSTSSGDAFAMHVDWKPSEEFTTLAKMAMVQVPQEIGEFVSYWISQSLTKRTQAEWDHTLIKNLKAAKLRAESTPAAGSKPAKFDAVDYVNNGGESSDEHVIVVN